MDPAAYVKGKMRFFRKKNQPGGGPSGGSPSDREIPRPPHAPLPPIHAGRRAAGAGCFYACGGRGLKGFMVDPAAAAEGKTRLSLFWMQKSSGAGDRLGSGREIPRAGNPRHPRLQRFCKRNGGAGLYARVRGGWAGSVWLHNGSNGRRGGKRVFPENFSMRNTGRAGEASSARATRGAPPCAFTSDS